MSLPEYGSSSRDRYSRRYDAPRTPRSGQRRVWDAAGGWIIAAVVVLVVVGGLVGLTHVGVGDYYLAHTWADFSQSSAPFWMVTWLTVVPFAFAIAGYVAATGRWGSGPLRAAAGAVCAVLAVAAVVPAFAAWRYTTMGHGGYESLRWFAASLTDADGTSRPTYDERLNLPQARLLLTRGLDGIPGDLNHVTPLGDDRVCGTVERDASMGRRWTTTVVCLDETSHRTTTADFAAETVGTSGGSWGSRLGAQLTEIDPALGFDDSDVYGYIDADGAAHLVVPVTRVEGGVSPRRVPAGVVTFDADGRAELRRDVAAGDIPGPVLAESVAAEVRAALNTRDGYLAWRHPKGNADALETTDRLGGLAAADPNAENVSEWILRRADDGRVVYVTPLTAFGSGRSVVAYLEVAADTVDDGVAPTATLYRLDQPEASPQDITQRVTTLYDADVDWADGNAAGDSDSNKVRIYEVTPAGPGQVVLTVGTGVQTLYRVRVDARLDDTNRPGQVCVFAYTTNTKLRCDDADAMPAPVGSLRGLGSDHATGPGGDGPAPGGATPTVVPGGDLSSLSADELRAVIDAAVGELARRAVPTTAVPAGGDAG